MPKRRQTEIPGTERPRDDELSDAADALHKVRKSRMKLTQKETEAADKLLDLMRSKKLTEYVDEDLELRVTIKEGKTRVSVTGLKDDEAEAAE